MKRIRILSTVILVLCIGVLVASAAGTSERTGLSHEWMVTRQTEYPTGSYNCEKLLERLPVTMEAWVYLPGDSYDSLAGTILGNKPQKSQAAFTFSIEENGVPQLSFGYVGGEHNFKFTNAAIPADTWTHVAVVYGTGAEGKQVYCYINGELKQSSATSKWYAASMDVLSRIVGLAGDRQQVNMEGFRGILGDVAVYSDVRTAEEILSDVTNEPDVNDAELLMYYDLDGAVIGEDIKDSSKNGYHMIHEKMWLTQAERDAIFAEDENTYAYTIAFIPDIQISTRLYYSRLKPIFSFLIDNKESMNIQYAISLGDLTDNNTVEEWNRVVEQYNRLNDIVPYALIRGNHDIERNEWALLYDEHFGSQGSYYYNHVQKNGGFYDTANTQNTYLLFSVGQVDYIILNLDFGASDDVLSWADRVLTQYPQHRAIIVTHGYLQSNGQLLTGEYSGAPSRYVAEWNDADDMWDKLIRKHENIDLVACGHVGVDHIISSTNEGDNGNTVYQMLSDTQYVDRKILGAGIVTLMHFTEDGRFARAEHYSTVDKKYFRESNYEIKMDFGAAPGSEPAPEYGTIERYCEECRQAKTWQPLSADNWQETVTSGHYYLPQNISFGTRTISANTQVCLDLNGKTYTASQHIIMEKGAKLSIQGENGLMQGCGSNEGNPGRTIWIKAGSTLNLYSGTLAGLSSTIRTAGNGGVLAVYGTFNMYGGLVRDGISSAIGGSLFVDRAGIFNMYGGEIRGGTAGSSGDCAYTRGKTLLSNDASIDQLMVSPKSGYTTTQDLLTIQGAYTGKVCLSFEKASEAGVVMGISDDADLAGSSIYFTNNDLRVKVEGDTLMTYLPDAADVIDENGSVVSYNTLAEALDNLQDGNTLVLHHSSANALVINKSILLDLNGRKINNTLTAADGSTVWVMDSTTADYSIADGVYGKVKAISGNVLPAEATEDRDPYLKIQGSSYISYHAVGLNIHSMALRPEESGLYYLNDFAGDTMVAEQVESFGIVLSVDGVPDEATMSNSNQFTSYGKVHFDQSADSTGTLLTGILKESNDEKTNLRNGSITVYGRAYVRFTDGQYLFGIARQRSLKEQVQAADAMFDSLEEQQKQALADLYNKFPETLGTWELDNLASYLIRN